MTSAPTRLLAVLAISLACASSAKADLIWTETFTQADGAFTDRATETGAGFVDVDGNVSIVGNALQIVPDGGSDRVEFESSAGALAGNFQFDLTYDANGGTSDVAFLQMVEGTTRSTNGSPVNNFADTVDASVLSITTTPRTINYFFNVSGVDVDYTAPDGSMQTIATGGYDLWTGMSLSVSDQTNSGQGASAPNAGVDTLVFQLFGGQAPAIWTIDEASFNTLDFTPVPEPSSLALVVLAGLVVAGRRRRD